MPQRHTIEVGIIVDDDGSIKVQKFNDELKETGETLKDAETAGSKFGKGFDNFVSGAYERAGQMATEFLSQLPAQIVELGKLGAQAQAAELRFNQFAGGAERADEFLTAFNEATMGTVDRMGAMTSAAGLLQMGLVDNSTEMASVAEMATKLGDQTLGATERISSFALMMANQSIPRLDNFGISSGKVRARIQELQKATADMSREEAFKIAVMEQGARSLNTLGDTSELAQVKIDKMTAAVQDAKIGLGELALQVIGTSGDVDVLADKIRGAPGVLKQWLTWMRAAGDVQRETNRPMLHASAHHHEIEKALKARIRVQKAANIVFEEAAFIERVLTENSTELTSAQEAYFAAVKKSDAGITSYTSQTYLADDATRIYKKTQSELEWTVLQTIHTLEQEEATLLALQNVSLNAGVQFTQFFRDVAEQQEEFGATREELESDHLANLEDLRTRGQATLIQIDADAEQAKLEKLRQNLELALLDQSAFTDKTKEATQRRKEIQIAELQADIGAQQKLLDDFYNGRLIRAGENVDALIATENTRHTEAIAGLEEEMRKTQELQDQQMAQLLLQTFDQWAEVSDVPPEKMLEMRLAVSEEFGLISEEQALMVDGAMTKWDEWLASTDTTAIETVKAINTEIRVIQDLAEELARLPTQKEITIRIRTEGMGIPSGGTPGPGIPEDMFQHGFNGIVGPGFGGPRNMRVGEGASPERVVVQPMTQNEFNLTVNSRASTPSVVQDFAMMRALVN